MAWTSFGHLVLGIATLICRSDATGACRPDMWWVPFGSPLWRVVRRCRGVVSKWARVLWRWEEELRKVRKSSHQGERRGNVATAVAIAVVQARGGRVPRGVVFRYQLTLVASCSLLLALAEWGKPKAENSSSCVHVYVVTIHPRGNGSI